MGLSLYVFVSQNIFFILRWIMKMVPEVMFKRHDISICCFLFIYLFSDKIIRNICITSLFFLGLLILLCHGHSWHIGFWEFNISVSSDVLVCGNIWQLGDKEQKPVQLQKFRVIPSSSSLGLSGSYLILQSSSSVLNYR